METIQTLVKGLRQGHPLPQWTFRQLPGGSSNPLVKAGVLTPVRDLPEDWIRIWEYDADRMAALISAAMGCEHHLPQHRDGHWSLGIAKDAIGKNRRELIVATRLDSLSDSVLETIKNNGSILFVGLQGCKIPEAQVERRVFQFKDVLRFDAEGRLSVLHDVISSRFGGEDSPRRHKKGEAEKNIVNFLFERVKVMLEYDIGDREKARQEITVGWIAEGTHASEGNVSRILHVNDIKGMSTSSNSWNIAQIYYGICQHEELFNVFQEVAGEYQRSLQAKDSESIATKVITRFRQKVRG